MTRPRTVVQTPALWSGALFHRLCRRLVPLIALVIVTGALTVLGCGSSSPTFSGVTANDLANRAFTFPTGAGALLSKAPCGPQEQAPCGLGLPQGQAFTLQFGNFEGTNTGPVRLDSGGSTASGTVSLGSASSSTTTGMTVTICTFQFNQQSTFSAGLGPQVGTHFTSNPCEVDRAHNTMRLTPVAGETEVSAPFAVLPTTNAAFVLSTDFSTGSYSVVDLTSRFVFKDIKRGGVGSDAIARFFNGRVYVVNRLPVDSIQIFDPQQGFTTPTTNGALSVDSGSDPQDIAVVNANKAYVSRLGSARLLIIDPTTLTRLGELDLSGLVKPNDSDGSPDPTYMMVRNGLVYVTLRHIDFNTPSPMTKVANGEVAVIDPTNDRIRAVIQLNGKNPLSELQFSPTLNRILVSSVGDFASDNGGLNDGGIDAINPDTNTVDAQFVVDEATMGGDITTFALVSRTKGFAVVRDVHSANSLVTFNPSTRQRLNSVVGPLNVPVPDVAINSLNEVYLAVADTQTPTPGLRIFDAITDREITTTPLNVGQLPPAFILFIE